MEKQWYVITNNTSWSNVDEAVLSGPYTTKKDAMSDCKDTSYWPELLTKDEVEDNRWLKIRRKDKTHV
jgi:hypothetical protein